MNMFDGTYSILMMFRGAWKFDFVIKRDSCRKEAPGWVGNNNTSLAVMLFMLHVGKVEKKKGKENEWLIVEVNKTWLLSLSSGNAHFIYSHSCKFITTIFSYWKLKLLKIYGRNLWELLAIVTLTFTTGIDFLKEEMKREQPAAKWLLSLNSSCKLASPWLHWKLMELRGRSWSTPHNSLLQGQIWISMSIEAHFRNWLSLQVFCLLV